MPTEQQENGSTGETQDQEQQGQQQQTTSETEGNGTQQQAEVAIDDNTQLPDTHPLVKKLGIQKGEISSLKTELTEARAKSAQVTKLEQERDARPTQEALDTLQTRYDRLEAFLVAAGGPLGKALDSRTFTRDLFESDKDIDTLVKDWHKNNPSATATALGSGAAAPKADTKSNMNELLRAAAKG